MLIGVRATMGIGGTTGGLAISKLKKGLSLSTWLPASRSCTCRGALLQEFQHLLCPFRSAVGVNAGRACSFVLLERGSVGCAFYCTDCSYHASWTLAKFTKANAFGRFVPKDHVFWLHLPRAAFPGCVQFQEIIFNTTSSRYVWI